jgi:hypothetical protein|tara:strand:+ start:364 stop:546 length:183 start_codon:yes stop_codon:yes gene_type:complete
MHPEIKQEIKLLKESIAHYESELKRPVWNYKFDKEDSHTRAKRLIQFKTKQLVQLESWYE